MFTNPTAMMVEWRQLGNALFQPVFDPFLASSGPVVGQNAPPYSAIASVRFFTFGVVTPNSTSLLQLQLPL